jgi:8-oxo-dGTP pyrophosphatase MutT (NUDIX family)/2'-5' RNA ligase
MVNDYGCLMLKLNIGNWSDVLKLISKDDLYEVPNENYGYEENPHVTVLYGFHDNINVNQLKNITNNFVIPIVIKAKDISIFEGEEYDVVKMSCESEVMSILNEISKMFPYTSDFPDYRPHCTIAYVKKGLGKNYIKSFTKPMIFKSNIFQYSDKNNNITEWEIKKETTKKTTLNECIEIDDNYKQEIKNFIDFAKKYLNIDNDVKVILTNKKTPDLQTSAYYDIKDNIIKVYIKNRHLLDIMRSTAHELTHTKQNLEGKIKNVSEDGADGSPIEDEANAIAGRIIREYGRMKPSLYENELKGGKADNFTVEDIMSKHNLSYEEIKNEIIKGITTEKEHTDSISKAFEITLDHLYENGEYYTKLKDSGLADELNESMNIKNIFYHGSLDKHEFIETGNMVNGTFFSTNFNEAKSYAGKNGYVFKVKLNKDLNLFNDSNIEDVNKLFDRFDELYDTYYEESHDEYTIKDPEKFLSMNDTWEAIENTPDVLNWLEGNYDGVFIHEGGVKNLLLFNPVYNKIEIIETLPLKNLNENNEKIHEATAVTIKTPTNKFLICKRSEKDDWMPNHWGLVGGGIENGEDYTIAAKREVYEETKLTPKNFKLSHVRVDGNKTKVYFICAELNNIEIPDLSFEHTDYLWIENIDDLEKLNCVPNLKNDIIKSLKLF